MSKSSFEQAVDDWREITRMNSTTPKVDTADPGVLTTQGRNEAFLPIETAPCGPYRWRGKDVDDMPLDDARKALKEAIREVVRLHQNAVDRWK